MTTPKEVKLDEAPKEGQPNPQPSMKELEDRFAALVEQRVRGVQSAFEKRLNEVLEKVVQSADSDNDDPRPFTSRTKSEQALLLREQNVARKEAELAKANIAATYNVPVEELVGDNEVALTLSAMSLRVKRLEEAKKAEAEAPKPDDEKPKEEVHTFGFIPVTGGATPKASFGASNTVDEVIQAGVKDLLGKLRT